MRTTILKSALAAVLFWFFFWQGSHLLSLRHFLLFGKNSGQSDEDLKSENMALRTELEKYLSIKNSLIHFRPEYLNVLVYSSYPLNDKSELVLGAGEKDGAKVKMAVTTNGLFLGKIDKVGRDISTAKTIFDSSVEMPVKIGDKGASGLLKGGAKPKITLISNEAKAQSGMGVYSASGDLPYGLPIGELGNLTQDSGDIWEEAPLRVAYDPDYLITASILTNAR